MVRLKEKKNCTQIHIFLSWLINWIFIFSLQFYNQLKCVYNGLVCYYEEKL